MVGSDMQENQHCGDHSGHGTRLSRCEQDIQAIFTDLRLRDEKKSNTNVSAWLFAGTALLSLAGIAVQFLKG